MPPRRSALLVSVPHPTPLLEGRLIDRYERFIAAIELASGERVRAHCVNPGRMEGQVRPGVRAWVSAVPADSKRKLRYTWELVEEASGARIELEGNRLPVTHSKDVIEVLAG